MDIVYKTLVESGFERVSNKSGLLVVHCVPGGGKSTVIRKLLAASRRFVAVTFGVPDPVTLSCERIRAVGEDLELLGGELLIVDEYCIGDWEALKPAILFGDPCQGVLSKVLRPDFIKTKTQRFGNATCTLLRSLGFQIESTQEDIVVFCTPFDFEPEGQIIALGQEACDLLNRHRVPFKKPCCIRGSTFSVVTLVTEFSHLSEVVSSELYQCLTRHRNKLIILNPDAAFSSN
nr:MAG: triple gene block protein 1 [Xinjiang betaflexivirus 2]